MTQTDDLEAPIRAMIDATNAGDSGAFLAAFADDAEIDDWGRTFAGTSEIARWNDNENIGVRSRISVTGVERSGATVTIGVEVRGDGYNGGGAFVFELAGGRIARLRITG